MRYFIVKSCPRCQTEIKLFTLPEGTMTDPAPTKMRLFVVKRCPNCGKSFDSPSPTDAVDIAPEDVTVLPPPLPGSDPLFNDVVKFLAGCRSITPMMLRDHFKITDQRANDIIRQLEEAGIIGPYNHGGPRQILIPHTGLYDHYQPIMPGPTRRVPNNNQPQPRPGRIGCFTWFIIITFIIILTRACTG